MPLKKVYITKTSSFFPNKPISNDEMESYLGLINQTSSKSKGIVLRNNGIKTRYYALTREGKPTHTNAEMTALAIKGLFNNDAEKLKDIQFLSCGTSSPDQLIPSHAIMVHGWLPETSNIEVVSAAGVCCAGMHALKYAYLAVKAGDVENAVATGSERISASLASRTYEDEVHKLQQLKEDPYIGFEKEFLRWMLSDGAAAFLLSDKKNEEELSLEINWIESTSFANIMEVCMYMGADKLKDGSLKSYLDYTQEELLSQSILSIKQDVKLLSKYIIELGGEVLKKLLIKRNLNIAEVDYFLPHMSSTFFKDKIYNGLKKLGMEIPYEKWFVNLPSVGNVGSCSAYLMVDELFHNGKLKKGQKILLMVPESARFSYVYVLLTVC